MESTAHLEAQFASEHGILWWRLLSRFFWFIRETRTDKSRFHYLCLKVQLFLYNKNKWVNLPAATARLACDAPLLKSGLKDIFTSQSLFRLCNSLIFDILHLNIRILHSCSHFVNCHTWVLNNTFHSRNSSQISTIVTQRSFFKAIYWWVINNLLAQIGGKLLDFFIG